MAASRRSPVVSQAPPCCSSTAGGRRCCSAARGCRRTTSRSRLPSGAVGRPTRWSESGAQRLRLPPQRRVAGCQGDAPVRSGRLGRRRLLVAPPPVARHVVGDAPARRACRRLRRSLSSASRTACSSGRWAARRDATAGSARLARHLLRRRRSAPARSRSASGTGGCAPARSRCRSCSTSSSAWPVRRLRLPSVTRRPTGCRASEIRFEGVRFGYPSSRPRAVFDGFDLTIPAGTSLAIVGQNGAGKTTLAKLLCRLYDPVGGFGVGRRHRPARARSRRVALAHRRGVPGLRALRAAAARTSRRAARRDAAVRSALSPMRAEPPPRIARHDPQPCIRGRHRPVGRAVAACRVGSRPVCGPHGRRRRHPRRADRAARRARRGRDLRDRLIGATRGTTTILISHRFSTVRRADHLSSRRGSVIEVGSTTS